jgi:hypothetical protein
MNTRKAVAHPQDGGTNSPCTGWHEKSSEADGGGNFGTDCIRTNRLKDVKFGVDFKVC